MGSAEEHRTGCSLNVGAPAIGTAMEAPKGSLPVGSVLAAAVALSMDCSA